VEWLEEGTRKPKVVSLNPGGGEACDLCRVVDWWGPPRIKKIANFWANFLFSGKLVRRSGSLSTNLEPPLKIRFVGANPPTNQQFVATPS
jgi:hypothetical protein